MQQCPAETDHVNAFNPPEISMKMRAAMIAATLVAFAAVSGAALAAEDTAVVAKPATTDVAKSSPAAQPPAVKKSKPHSHVQEKTGVAPTQAPPLTEEEKARKDKMHQHPRDAK
jgi:hypothetical protein